MTMRVIYAFLMVLFFTSLPVGMVSVSAQDQPSSSEHQPLGAADIVVKMQSKLNLTQDQVAAVSPIIEKYSSKREELRQSIKDPSKDKDSIRSQMKQLKEDENQELSQFLSSNQMSQWEQMQKSGHKHSSEGEGGDG